MGAEAITLDPMVVVEVKEGWRTYPLSVLRSIYRAMWLKLIPAAYESL